MLKRQMTILLIGLMCLSSVSGFSTVICQGSNGHIAVEPAFHNHCQSSESTHQDEFSHQESDSPTGHNHCKDSISTSNYIVLKIENIKLLTHKIVQQNPILKSVSAHTTFSFGYVITKRDELSSFFEPLKTVVLLA